MTEKYNLGPDVDLDDEELYDSHGNRIDQTYIDDAVNDIEHATGGRPSLTGNGIHSPQVSFRVPEQLGRLAVERAEREGKSLSQLSREALEQYLSDAR